MLKKKMKIKKIIEDINKVDDQNTVFEESSSTLKSKFKILENIPKDLNEYLEFCIPKQPYGRMVEFHDIYTIIEENRGQKESVVKPHHSPPPHNNTEIVK